MLPLTRLVCFSTYTPFRRLSCPRHNVPSSLRSLLSHVEDPGPTSGKWCFLPQAFQGIAEIPSAKACGKQKPSWLLKQNATVKPN